jgi:hypothetical protein
MTNSPASFLQVKPPQQLNNIFGPAPANNNNRNSLNNGEYDRYNSKEKKKKDDRTN